MHYKQKCSSVCILVAIITTMLAGCEPYSNEVSKIGNMQNTNLSMEMNLGDSELYQLGKRIKELETDTNINYPVIRVGDLYITKKDIERIKIHGEFEAGFSIKNKVDTLIQKKAIVYDATKLGIEPDLDQLNTYIEQTKTALKSDEFSPMSSHFQSYLDGREISEDDYFEELRDIEYQDFLITAWWEYVKPTDEINAEAMNNHSSIDSVEKQYYAHYVDELISKTKIEILDPEVSKIMKE